MSETRRWYDRDPILSKAMRILETSDDKIQIQVAINLIKIIIEHHINENAYATVDDILKAVELGESTKGNGRWYDIDKTVRTAIQMLENCPPEMQNRIAKEMANIITVKFNDINDEDEE